MRVRLRFLDGEKRWADAEAEVELGDLDLFDGLEGPVDVSVVRVGDSLVAEAGRPRDHGGAAFVNCPECGHLCSAVQDACLACGGGL